MDDSTPTNAARNTRSANAQTPSRTTATPRAEPLSSARRPVHTPLNRTPRRDLLNSVRRGVASASGGARRNNAPTPHAQAARRALDQRRTAAFTPGRSRRKSQRDQRETPMGLLRNLSKVLAPASKPVYSSSSSPRTRSSVTPIREEDDDDEDELTIERPRLSLPLFEDDDEEDLQPPRLSGLENENYTVQSVELPRREAVQDQRASRLSRGSLGSVRVSDFFNNEPTEDLGRQSDFFPGLLEDLQAQGDAEADFAYERVDDPARRGTLGRESDFGLQMPEFGDQTTFLMSEPGQDVAPTSPLEEREFDEANAGNEGDDNPAPDYFFDAGGGGDDDDDDDMGGEIEMPDEQVDTMGGMDTTRGFDTETTITAPVGLSTKSRPRPKQKRVSRHGIEYPGLPSAFVKGVAQKALQSSGLSNPRVSADTLTALTQASEWFFEQLGDDLGAYADHGKRKTIEESDVVTLMRRQRQVGSTSTMFSLAQKHLPRELLQELRMPVPQPAKHRRAKKAAVRRDEEDASEIT